MLSVFFVFLAIISGGAFGNFVPQISVQLKLTIQYFLACFSLIGYAYQQLTGDSGNGATHANRG